MMCFLLEEKAYVLKNQWAFTSKKKGQSRQRGQVKKMVHVAFGKCLSGCGVHGGRKNVEVAGVGRQLEIRLERLALKCRRQFWGPPAAVGGWPQNCRQAWCSGGRSTMARADKDSAPGCCSGEEGGSRPQ